jgi:hypothetical protein
LQAKASGRTISEFAKIQGYRLLVPLKHEIRGGNKISAKERFVDFADIANLIFQQLPCLSGNDYPQNAPFSLSADTSFPSPPTFNP